MQERVLCFDRHKEEKKKPKFCDYKGISYMVQQENELSKIHIRKDGKTVTMDVKRYYIIVNGKKLYLNLNGTKVCNKQPNKSSEVSFLTPEEVEMVKQVFRQRVNKACTPEHKLCAWKNYVMFFIGINVGLRASDLRTLTWGDVYDENWNRVEGYWFKSKKTKKATRIDFNSNLYAAVDFYKEKYVELMKCEPKRNEYLFFSRKGGKPIIESSMWEIISDVAKECGIKKNIGSHTLRKTFGRNMYNIAEDKNARLVTLCEIYEHSSTEMTMKYIGITQEMKREAVFSLDGLFGEV